MKWVETRDWEKALYSVIPKRKFVDSGNAQKDDDDEDEELDGEGGGEDPANELDGPGRRGELVEDL